MRRLTSVKARHVPLLPEPGSFRDPLNFITAAPSLEDWKECRIWISIKLQKADGGHLDMDPSYGFRDHLNVGFSGGEKKKAEILQLLLLNPSLAILDETDSGLDVDAVRTVSKGIEEYQKSKDGALLIITHSTGSWSLSMWTRPMFSSTAALSQRAMALSSMRSTRTASNSLSLPQTRRERTINEGKDVC